MSRPTPAVVNADAQTQARKLNAIVNSARLLGLCFLGFGLLIILASPGRMRRDPISLFITSSLTSSGALYVVFAVFLRKRRYWAWVATLIMTVVLLGAVAVFTYLVISDIVRDFGRWGRPELWEILIILAGPGLWLGCWLAALSLILRYLGQSLPAVREQEAVAQKGFAVIPMANLAAPRDGGRGD